MNISTIFKATIDFLLCRRYGNPLTVLNALYFRAVVFLVLVGLIGGSESRWAYHAAFWGFAIVLLNVIVMTIYTGISNRAYLLDNEWIEPVKKKTRLEKLADKTVQSMIDGFNSPKAKSS